MLAKRFIQLAFLFYSLSASFAMSQTTDTQVDVGGNQLNFHVIKGQGMPILFEAGGGDDSTVWSGILPPLARITNATLIAYDRPGFGKSGLDRKRHGIVNGVSDLEKGLKALGYDGSIMLVAHSLGGLYAELYAARHPDRVKSIVLIDATESCFLTPEELDITEKTYKGQMGDFKAHRPGVYYLLSDYRAMADVMRKVAFPPSIPVTDIVSQHPPFSSEAERQHWEDCHQQFARAATNRKGILAVGTGHYIFHDNPALVINAIVKAYADTLDTEQRSSLLERSLSFNMQETNKQGTP
ncbi:alpha/beta fold hydrolase [Dyella acidiphila]|uniref:Alpha/beta fold hydrolase n=1 Tax=Dyella acidiphila TaxID=2775866 RepID=A0ABR9G7Z0_9GAMM|nr:alpha/beta fold hydrolase [Dyella acidiphila]MBE1160174.1 alpha/beta fold hydrolase [Dyella acidiphila]